MTATLINLIPDLKTCLALALGSGLLLGYLYTKFKARELFKPDVKNLKKNIHRHHQESMILLSKNSRVEEEIEHYDGELHKVHLEATKYKNEVQELETNLRTLESEGVYVKDKHQKDSSKLNNYKEEITTLKDELGLEDISKIKEHKANLHQQIQKTADKYQQKCDSLAGFLSDEKQLEKENAELKYKVTSLTAELNKKGLELDERGDVVSTIREKLQKEFDDLLLSKKENESTIQHYKKQLLTIKENLS